MVVELSSNLGDARSVRGVMNDSLRTTFAACPLGTILDLSASGMRVRHEAKPPVRDRAGDAADGGDGLAAAEGDGAGGVAEADCVGQVRAWVSVCGTAAGGACFGSVVESSAQHGYIGRWGRLAEETGTKAGSGGQGERRPRGESPLKAAVTRSRTCTWFLSVAQERDGRADPAGVSDAGGSSAIRTSRRRRGRRSGLR